MTIIDVESTIFESLCAIKKLVLFLMIFANVDCSCLSISLSTFDVASSKIKIVGSKINALAIVISCLCPKDKFLPSSNIFASYPSFSVCMKASAPASSAFFAPQSPL